MEAIYQNRPTSIEQIGENKCVYRWEMTQLSTDNVQSGMWKCQEVTFSSSISRENIKQSVIIELWPNNEERKLVNDYNSAKEGIFTGLEAIEKINAYKEFLIFRKQIKEIVDADCELLGIS